MRKRSNNLVIASGQNRKKKAEEKEKRGRVALPKGENEYSGTQ